MLIMEDGSYNGILIGGGCVESEVNAKAPLMMRKANEPVFQLCKVDMTADDAEEEGRNGMRRRRRSDA